MFQMMLPVSTVNFPNLRFVDKFITAKDQCGSDNLWSEKRLMSFDTIWWLIQVDGSMGT